MAVIASLSTTRIDIAMNEGSGNNADNIRLAIVDTFPHYLHSLLAQFCCHSQNEIYEVLHIHLLSLPTSLR